MAQVSISRPPSALITPTVIDQAFERPEEVIDLIDQGSPYKTLAAVHRDPPALAATPWFRNFWALGGKVVFPGADAVFHNQRFIDEAKALFDADVVMPLTMMTNLNGPGPSLPPHLDLPFFRGAHQREVPSWLLGPMGYSGLFHRWAIPVASVITWFYRGEGGEFEIWPDGLDQPSLVFDNLADNQAVMADNEYTYHRVRGVGAGFGDAEQQATTIAYDATLVDDGDHWVVRHGSDEISRHRREDIRLSVLWKAFCFADQDQADAFTSGRDRLTPAQIVEMFQADLRRRGVTVEAPNSLDGDDRWATAVRETYIPEG